MKTQKFGIEIELTGITRKKSGRSYRRIFRNGEILYRDVLSNLRGKRP